MKKEKNGGGGQDVCEIERTHWVKCANSRQKISVLYMQRPIRGECEKKIAAAAREREVTGSEVK